MALLSRGGEHVLSVAYSEDLRCFHGVAWPYVHGGEQRLVGMDADGTVQTLRSLGTPATTGFIGGASVTSKGDVIDLESLTPTRLWPLPVDEQGMQLPDPPDVRAPP